MKTFQKKKHFGCEFCDKNFLRPIKEKNVNLTTSRYESDLSNEVLCSLVAQRAVKLLEVKVANLEKIVLQIKVD